MSTSAVSASVLDARMRERSRVIIEAELCRLAGRARGLRPDDLAVVDTALNDLVESLVLARLREGTRHADRLSALFDISDA